MEPTFFKTGAAFRKWLEQNAPRKSELLVGFYRKDSGRPSLTWEESRDEALCFGWIDGVRKRRDDESYSIRFTPRKAQSRWSKVNVERVAALTKEGRMTVAGRRAFDERDRGDVPYSYEDRPKRLPPKYARELSKHAKAKAHFDAQAPGYRKSCIHWVLSAKREETRVRRLQQLIESSRKGEPIPLRARAK